MSARAWRRLRQAVQVLAFSLYVVLFVLANGQRPRHFWADLFSRLDPLLMLTAGLAGRILLAGMLLAGAVLLLTLVFGRAWCGWLCPLGSVLEWLSPRRAPSARRSPPPDRLRRVKVLLLLVLLAAALLGNQSLAVLDPITILNRTLSTAAWPALRYAVQEIEAFLYSFPWLWAPLDAVHEAVVQPVFQQVQPVFALAPLVALFFAGLVALNWWAPRFWCRYLCPLGGFLGVVSRLSLVRRQVSRACTQCARCTRRCPTGTVDAHDNYRSDPAECIVCYDCLVDCPGAGVAFRWQLPRWRPAQKQSYDPTRRQLLAAVGASVAGVALAGVEPIVKRRPATMIRPPGASLTDFEALCARCSACIRACPTQGLQPSLFEGGLQNVATPRLVPRLGFCDYGCTACSQVCPTGAIPRLDLADKQVMPIGLAAIDRHRCLPWAYDVACIVCEETCPVPDKAIALEEVPVVDERGEEVILHRPHVVKELCIGCGVCEYKCPMGGEAAIRVYAPTSAGLSPVPGS